MKWDDLLNVPYKHGGRDKNGIDCYGLVLECCRRAGTPLRDLFLEFKSIDANKANDYIDRYLESGVNARRIEKPKPGCIVEMVYNGMAHAGFMVDRNTVLHATMNRGVKTTPLAACKAIAFYEVDNEGDDIQSILE